MATAAVTAAAMGSAMLKSISATKDGSTSGGYSRHFSLLRCRNSVSEQLPSSGSTRRMLAAVAAASATPGSEAIRPRGRSGRWRQRRHKNVVGGANDYKTGAREKQGSGGHVPDEGDDVGHDAGDVVRAAARVSRLDQPPGRLLGIGQAAQRVPDDLGADHGGQAVRAQQVPVARLGVVQRGVEFHGAAVNGPQQQ